MSKQRTPFAVSKEGNLYVEVRAIMHPLIPYVDGLTLTFFGKEKKAYLSIEQAIKWVNQECLDNVLFARGKGGEISLALTTALEKFQNGKFFSQ